MKTCKGCNFFELRTVREISKKEKYSHEIFCKDREMVVFRYFSSHLEIIDTPAPDDCKYAKEAE
jgi:hypothetical protein